MSNFYLFFFSAKVAAFPPTFLFFSLFFNEENYLSKKNALQKQFCIYIVDCGKTEEVVTMTVLLTLKESALYFSFC